MSQPTEELPQIRDASVEDLDHVALLIRDDQLNLGNPRLEDEAF